MMNDFSSAYKDKVRILCAVARDRAVGSVWWSRSVDLPPTLLPETARPTCQSHYPLPEIQNSLSEAITEINAPQRNRLKSKIYFERIIRFWFGLCRGCFGFYCRQPTGGGQNVIPPQRHNVYH